ncbi:integrator complex subunit 7 isoform X4 [Cynara cardunculus var. scolymus]|uniref:integrator complex subunit 7 isoform X4 n=1 Tax=Cynara cardunculus var. scolymus TaxID=59895 RepID=UPI000D62D459|nr:integrator complex subunit 7 isoform X4 [Cynara cardunculus var. scolymus]
MEKTPAACAMDWSIRLDKALRSSNPGKRTEAIEEVGARLEWWSQEPELMMAEYDMFGLVPGEDKLFANAILLRLADAFVSGDKHTKLCVVKILLSELKQRKMKSPNRKNKGILLGYKVENHLELLRRIKLCFNSGDEDIRALALVLFGCWSDFAKDNAEIRYLILSSVVSCHVLEVKASLFAAGCFCEISDDFACVLLEMLVNIVLSSEMPLAGRLAGVRSFAKLGRSSAVSSRAYEEGLKLVSGLADDTVPTMLISLSIIASRSALLISRQVDLLHSFLSQDKALPLQATSLRCLHIILSRRRFRFSPPMELMSSMFNMLDGELPPSMQCDALHILYEILMSKMLSFSPSEMHACFTKLLTVVEISMRSPFVSDRLFAMHVVADISGKFTRRRDMPYDGDDKTLASQAISFLVARITLLVNSVLKLNQPDMEMEKEIWSLLKITFFLLNECPDLGEFALHKLHLLINCLLNKDEVLSTGKEDLTGHVLIQCGRDHRRILSKFMVCVSKVIILCLKSMVKAGPLSNQVQNVVRLIIEDVCGCTYIDYYVHTVYYLLLQPHANCHYMLKEMEEEMKIQYCSSPKERSVLLTWLESNGSSALSIVGDIGEVGKTTTKEINLHHYIESLDEVCKILQASKELLFNRITPSGQHYFQMQFLSLRVNVIEIVLHAFKLLDTVSFQEDNIRNNRLKRSTVVQSAGHLHHAASLVQPLTQLSTRLMKLAQEYDLLATSFIDIDKRSAMIISAHALSCSALAFITGFSLFFANLDSLQQFPNLGLLKLQSNFHAMLIHDLVARLWHIDQETSKQLLLLLKTCFGQSKSCNVPQAKIGRLEYAYEVRSIIMICQSAVKGVVGIQNAAKRLHDGNDEIILQITKDGLGLQLDTVRNWLNISFRTPRYFFRVRPSVSCQLFAMNRDCGNGERISVLPECHLHLDLCLQLTDISPESRVRLTKLYCILQCKMSYQLPCQTTDSERKTQAVLPDQTDDNVLELNEKLVKYVNNYDRFGTNDKNHTFDGQIAESVVCFRLNGKGQGFSTCILDVSMFPLGSYKIKWHAGCMDIDGSYWSLNSLNSGPVVFTIQKSR